MPEEQGNASSSQNDSQPGKSKPGDQSKNRSNSKDKSSLGGQSSVNPPKKKRRRRRRRKTGISSLPQSQKQSDKKKQTPSVFEKTEKKKNVSKKEDASFVDEQNVSKDSHVDESLRKSDVDIQNNVQNVSEPEQKTLKTEESKDFKTKDKKTLSPATQKQESFEETSIQQDLAPQAPVQQESIEEKQVQEKPDEISMQEPVQETAAQELMETPAQESQIPQFSEEKKESLVDEQPQQSSTFFPESHQTLQQDFTPNQSLSQSFQPEDQDDKDELGKNVLEPDISVDENEPLSIFPPDENVSQSSEDISQNQTLNESFEETPATDIPSQESHNVDENPHDDIFTPEYVQQITKQEQAKQIPELNEEDESKKDEGLAEKKSFLSSLSAFFSTLQSSLKEKIPSLRLFFGSGIFRNCFLFLIVLLVILAGYFFGFFESVYKYVDSLIHPPSPPQVEIEINEKEQSQWGIQTVYVFADNRGSVFDRLNSSLQNAFFFGTLSEPAVTGETGITPAYFFGLLLDEEAATNRFIYYVENLRQMQSVYRIDVYAMLDQTTQRDAALFEYLNVLKKMEEESTALLNDEILPQIDDFKVSYNSLNPDKARFETDFFDALSSLAGEKSDFLLKSFVDVTQKQTSIKARLTALQKIAEYYQTALSRLKIRIEAVEKNTDALIQGIRVVDIPGSDLDIIIRESN